MREACEIRRRTRKVGKPTQKTPPAKRDAQECETLQKVPRRREAVERISYWNCQIFCVNWPCFISPQGSHALWDGAKS